MKKLINTNKCDKISKMEYNIKKFQSEKQPHKKSTLLKESSKI